MNPQSNNPIESEPQLPTIKIHHPASPRHHHHHSGGPSATPTAGARRKIGVAVDLSDESGYSVHWAIHHYVRPGDAVVLLHVRPTSVLFGADWGSSDATDPKSKQKMEEDFDAFTASKLSNLAIPLKEAQIPYKIHIVKDHDMRERLCLEVERLGVSAVIMGNRGFGAAKRGGDGKLGSVSDYCVNHCVCPVVVVRYPDEKGGVGGGHGGAVVAVKPEGEDEPVVIEENVKDLKKDT